MDNSQLTINSLRILSAQAIEKANSGHPGLPLGSAPIAYNLFQNFLKFNPKNANFYDRDRFVLSAGHGSMLNYSLLYLYGYGLTKEDLQNFRQLGSKTPGHPEYKHTLGIETTTGPLGQGIANAVGMAIAESHLASKFNREGFKIVDHYTYALCGDGCMQEGISYESASLAGTLKLNKLIVFYDKNNITIEGNTNLAFTEDVGLRHKAMGWNVIEVKDANDVNALKKAVKKAKAQTEKPTLIICHTKIGYGSPLEGSEKSHGAPLGKENLDKLKENLGWNYPDFEVPNEVFAHCKKAVNKGKRAEKEWKKLFKKYSETYPELAKQFTNDFSGKIENLANYEQLFQFDKPDATRNTSSAVLNKLADIVPNLFGGSADLGPSNKTIMKNRQYYSSYNPSGSNMHYGIREHAMAGISNGIAVHGGLIPYCSTFFVFSDYMKNAVRISALMKAKVIYILTHDSIGVGEDGPTHQPIEQLISLRSIPNMKVFRPADGKETAYSWIKALESEGPSALVLTRQNLPQYENSNANALKGGYVLQDSNGKKPDCLLIATGSEVEICVNAKKVLSEQGINAKVISMPCLEVFESQSEKYKNSVINPNVKARVCVEAGTPHSMVKYAGDYGKIIAMQSFGTSAPYKVLFEKYGFTVENVVEKALESINSVK